MFAKLGAVAFAARAKTKRDILEDRKFIKDITKFSRINENFIEKSKFLYFQNISYKHVDFFRHMPYFCTLYQLLFILCGQKA